MANPFTRHHQLLHHNTDLLRIAAQSYLLTIYNIPRRLLPHAKKINPGKRAPKITSLDSGGGTGSPFSRPTTANSSTPLEKEGGGGLFQTEEQQEKEDWVAVNSMVKKTEVADVMDRLKELGATDILCLKIENSRAAA